MASSSCTLWLALSDSELTVDDVGEHLGSVTDDLWVAAACYDRIVDDVSVQQALLNVGLDRTKQAFHRAQDALSHLSSSPSSESLDTTAVSLKQSDSCRLDPAVAYFHNLPGDAQLCRLHGLLLRRLDRLNTFTEMCQVAPEEGGDDADDEITEWEDDPWADQSTAMVSHDSSKSPQFPVSLSYFITQELIHTACQLTLHQYFRCLHILLERHRSVLWVHRFVIYDSIPGFANPLEYLEFLPRVKFDENMEEEAPWKDKDIGDASYVPLFEAATTSLGIPKEIESSALSLQTCNNLMTSEELSGWYTNRVDNIISSTGMIDTALAVIQHGASQGVPGLDELGEELSLLTRLVYDAPAGDSPNDWTLSSWKSMDSRTVIRAYLSHSTPETVAADMLHLVMPYLYVLESRAERAGNPNSQIYKDLLYDYVLTASLDVVAAIFEGSKPTMPSSQRIIKDDEDMARLALACLYGSASIDEWPTMSRIFECLPAWDLSKYEDLDGDIADTTIASLGDFVTPTIARPRCTASDLLMFFKPLPLSSLSRALDILDVHLESGEILSRWSVAASLSWFLQSMNDEAEQKAWANRMARRAGSADQLSTREDWEWLLKDMIKLSRRGNSDLRGAFGLLSQEEVTRTFFNGLLISGKFDIAKALLQSNRNISVLDTTAIEDICLTCVREFYDNASSGNYKVGDMKLAYECLDVPHISERIRKEKEFIEATSRLSSFNVMSRPGIPITPIEIRLTKDRLSLVSRVLSSNADAYKHTEVILELVAMLGFRGDVTAEVKTLAMLADTALQNEDFTRAYQASERMVNTVLVLRSSNANASKMQEASEVCWVACFQLGRQPEFDDVEKKLSLLGRSLELCPPEQLHDVLTAWRRLEKEDIERRETRLSQRRRAGGAALPRKRTPAADHHEFSLRSRLADFHMPSPPLLSTPDAAALASRTFKTVAARFPFSRGRPRSHPDDETSRSGSRPRDGDDVSSQATRVFSKGIGWLLGAGEEDL
ncbi:Sec39-domain-containing protein [Guyanagaster necrorhizus]|uniref:Sec39-domain-containing protein n=1 Tax=Guyanagaster necrorhizus TaxID=856835 RepID=A0A9P7W1H9_9AGAR|nr:Sec39-domain-containing protein [Guyanagaster necrorhizus MCA 3950]KAG7450655.1 Sec39-domain-containing protein [Guyanagaster necrorhizus MCA 3950]